MIFLITMFNYCFSRKLYILFLFSALSFSLSAQREASTPQEKELVEAVSENFRTLAEHLLSEGIDVNTTDAYGQSLLMLAARNNNIELASLLIEKGANLNYRINQKAEYNSDESALSMLKLQKLSVLDYGIASGDVSMVKYLINAGAKLDIEKKDISSAVATASMKNSINMVSYLLSQGAKVSDETGLFLVVWHIIRRVDPVSGITKQNKNTDFSLIKIWDDYGIPLDDEKLLSLSLLRNERDRTNVINYMAAYREWLELGAILYQQYRESSSRPIPETMSKAEADSIMAIALENSRINRIEQDKINLEETEASQQQMVLFVLLVSSIFLLYIFRKRIKSLLSLLFPKKNIPPTPIPNNNPTPNRIPNVRAAPQPIQNTSTPSPSTKGKENESKAGRKLDISGKGWTEDDTVDIEVLFLTVEDMINPIQLKNEHEKAVREMIAYIRTLERLSDKEIINIMDGKGLVRGLNSLWESIDPSNVRDIYKRSLYILVEDFSKRDKRVNTFLNKRSWKRSILFSYYFPFLINQKNG